MLVSLTVNWAYATTPPSPFPVTVYWREKGSTGAYNLQPVATGTSITITTISNASDTLNSACTLEYEGYVIPNCFIDGATDCFAFLDDLVSPNLDCPDGQRSRWSASVPALSYQACRGVKVTCESSGVLSAHILDPNGTLKNATWDLNGGFYPDTVVTNQNTGGGFDAVVTVNPVAGAITNPQCLTVTSGSGYTTAPIANLAPSQQGYVYQLELTMGCREFTYQDCQTNGQDSGHILLNDFRTICLPADEFDGFDPQATNAVFSKEQIGCCSGNGRYYKLTFSNPDPTWYSNVTFAYALPNSTNPGEQWSQVRSLSNSVPFEVCAVEGSLVSYGPEPGGLVCKTDYQTNAFLFENHVLIEDLGPC